MTVIAVNAMILDERLSGIGHYIVQLLTHFARFNQAMGNPHRLLGIVRAQAAHHLATIPGVEPIVLPGQGGRMARVLAEQITIPRRLRRESVDVLLNPAFTGPTRGARRIAITVHDLYFRVTPELLPRAQRLFLSMLVPWCCRRADAVIAPSEATARDLLSHYPHLAGKVSVIPLANRFPAPATLPDMSSSPATAPFVLLVAALTGNKNPAPLVAAIDRLRTRHPDLALLHIGTDPEGRLVAARARHGADAWITSRSGVDDTDLAAAYRDCLCFAIPSLYEGFGLPLLEAQALGAPAIASDRGSLPEVGGEGALYVDPTDPAAIAAAIGDLIDSPARRQALRVAGFVNQARFSWERTAHATWNLLLENGTVRPARVENA